MESHASEFAELGQIDYFLDHLARAVEHGEVHRASYDLLAPRYLERRADLVRILRGDPSIGAEEWIRGEDEWLEAATTAPAEQHAQQRSRAAMLASAGLSPALTGPPAEQPARFDSAEPLPVPRRDSPTPTPRAVQPPRQAPRREPVRWSTVLLFLGAFLVIAASAIFSLTVWDTVGLPVKLGFLGAATVAFYAAGYFARTKLKLLAGSTALTVVGSAMLVFDCWIVIDSYSLTGPVPWAVALLFISAVYWLTEVVYGERIYGVAGAAAQVAWWWLAADGLHLDPIVRLAVIAAVGVGWQVLAARAVDDDAMHSLAEVLLWAAPIVEVIAAPAAVLVLVRQAPSDLSMVAAAAVVSASGAVVVMRSELIAERWRRWIAAVLQVPLFVAIFLGSGPSWTGVAFLAALTAAYILAALTVGGAAMALPAVAAETFMASAVLALLHVGSRGEIASYALLGLSWVVAAFLVALAAERGLPAWLWGAEETGRTLRVLGFVPLVLASGAAVLVSGGPALSGVTILGSDVALAAFLLALWIAAALVPRSPGPAIAVAAWSFYALATILAWAVPTWTPAVHASALVALAAAWLLLRGEWERLFRVNAEAFGGALRVLLGVYLLGGLLAQQFVGGAGGTVRMLLLVALAGVVYLADAFLAGESVSALAGALALVLVSLLNMAYLSNRYIAAAVALFGLAWMIAGRFVEQRHRQGKASDVARALRWGGFAALVAASISVPIIGSGVPLSGASIVTADALLSIALLAMWVAGAVVGRDPEAAIGVSAWSFYALAALLAVAAPLWHSAVYASAILVLATGWLLSRDALQRLFRVDAELFGWAMRGIMLAAWVGGLLAERHFFDTATSPATVALSTLVCVAFLTDALLVDVPVSAAVAGVAFVFAGDRLGWLIHGAGAAGILAGVAAVLAASAAWVVRGEWGRRSRWLAVASAIAVSLACVPSSPAYWLSGALALAALTWAFAAATAWEPLAFASGTAGLASIAAFLSAANSPGWATVAVFGSAAFALGLPSVLPSTRKSGPHELVGSSLAVAGGLGLAWLVAVGYAGRFLGGVGWLDIGAKGFAAALLMLGVFVVAQSVVRRVEPLLYGGCLIILFALFAEFRALYFTTAELFSTPAALYLVAMAYLYQNWEDDPPRAYPVVLDVAAVVVGLGVPVVLAISNTFGRPMVVHTAWAIGLSLLAIGAGIMVRSRAFLFGGTAALAVVAGWRTISYLAQLWWLVLGLVGVSLLVIALTWERQRQLIGETTARLRDSFEDWR